MLDPSQSGFTMTGKRIPFSGSSGEAITRNGGVETRWNDMISLARALFKQAARVNASEPVYGISSISQMTGTCDSLLGESIPSAMLKTMSGRTRFSFSARSRSASIPTTSRPPPASAVETASMVAESSHSAK